MIMLGRLGVGGFGHITEIWGVGLGGDNGTSSLGAGALSSAVGLGTDLNNLGIVMGLHSKIVVVQGQMDSKTE
jgi:hypothetical protein